MTYISLVLFYRVCLVEQKEWRERKREEIVSNNRKLLYLSIYLMVRISLHSQVTYENPFSCV